jgi:hypothetical protein
VIPERNAPYTYALFRIVFGFLFFFYGLQKTMGWFGGQAERYVARGRASVFAGVGYTPAIDDGDPSGATFAAGVRGYTGGSRHRGFLEASVSQIDVEMRVDGVRRYGPGLQIGYQYVARRGFTMLVSGGVGYPRGGDEILGSSATALFGFGMGYTWR